MKTNTAFENSLKKTIGLIVKGVTNNFLKSEVVIYFENEKSITFYDCALVYDSGIVGVQIGDYSNDAGLGMKLELTKITKESEEYFFCTLSRDFKDYENKKEIRISYKRVNSTI